MSHEEYLVIVKELRSSINQARAIDRSHLLKKAADAIELLLDEIEKLKTKP